MSSMACDAQTTLYRSGRETGNRSHGKGSAGKNLSSGHDRLS